MKLSTALVATLPRHQIRALVDAGCINKADLATISALRAGGGGEAAKQKIFSAVRKQFEERDERTDALRTAVGRYAQQRVAELTKEMKPMTMIEKMLTMNEATLMVICKTDGIPSAAHAHALLTELAKRRQQPGETKEQAYARVVTDGGLGSLLFHKHQELSRGWSVPGQAEALEKLVEHPVRKLGGGTLPQEKPGTMRTRHNTGPGTTNNPGDENVVESADEILQRIAATHEANGMSHAAAVLRAANDPEYNRAQGAETRRKFGG